MVQLEPEPLTFHRMPGASLKDFRNLSATFYFLQMGLLMAKVNGKQFGCGAGTSAQWDLRYLIGVRVPDLSPSLVPGIG
jgi:hypothetical protein